jgi:hypothetical protein
MDGFPCTRLMIGYVMLVTRSVHESGPGQLADTRSGSQDLDRPQVVATKQGAQGLDCWADGRHQVRCTESRPPGQVLAANKGEQRPALVLPIRLCTQGLDMGRCCP